MPKALRDALKLSAGAEVDIAVVEGRIEISPAPLEVELVRRGRFVIAVPRRRVQALEPADVEQVIDATRRPRGSA